MIDLYTASLALEGLLLVLFGSVAPSFFLAMGGCSLVLETDDSESLEEELSEELPPFLAGGECGLEWYGSSLEERA